MDEMRDKWKAGDLVAEYGSRNNLLNRKQWSWAKKFDPSKKDWFQLAQEHLSKVHIIYEHDRLRKSLHTIFQSNMKQLGRDNEVLIDLINIFHASH